MGDAYGLACYDRKKASRELDDKAAALLRIARDNYARGIDEIEAALLKL